MAIFSVVHLWAYPWRDYDLRQSRITTSEPDPHLVCERATSYSGGIWGTSALLDAFNPWDTVKGVARAFQWFVMGRRTREQDVSYTNSGLAIPLQPVRKVFALQFPTQEDGRLPLQCYSPVDNSSQTCIEGSSTYNDSHMIQEEEAAAEEENCLLSQAHSNSPTSSFLPIPSIQPQINQVSNQASANDTSTTSLPLESSIHLQEPYFRTDTPELTLPEFRALDIGLQEEDQMKHDPHLNHALPQRQAQSSITEPVQSSEEPETRPSSGSPSSLRR